MQTELLMTHLVLIECAHAVSLLQSRTPKLRYEAVGKGDNKSAKIEIFSLIIIRKNVSRSGRLCSSDAYLRQFKVVYFYFLYMSAEDLCFLFAPMEHFFMVLIHGMVH